MNKSKAIIDSIVESEEESTRSVTGRGVTWRNARGELHRVGGPADEWKNGTKGWYVNGKLHREDGPAVEWGGSPQEWARHGLLNMTYGSARDKEWAMHGKFHRTDGPARVWKNGMKEWWVDGKLHRIGGPSAENPLGIGKKWHVNGRRFTEDEYYRYVDPETGEVFVPPGKKLKYDKEQSDH
jgi:hypothetical protein